MCRNQNQGACASGCICAGERAATPAVEVLTRGAGSSPPAPIDTDAMRAAQRREQAEIVRLAENNGATRDQIAGWIERGATIGEVSQELLRARTTAALATQPAERGIGLPEKDAKRYSMARGIAGILNGRLDGLEREVHDDLAKRRPAGFGARGGLLVPMRLQDAREGAGPRGTRALGSNVGGSGAELVFDQPGELIELLRARAVVADMGARLLSDLTGPISWPRQKSAAVPRWMAQNPAAGATNSEPGFGLITLDPRTLIGNVAIPRQLIYQSNIDSEALVRDDLAIGHGLAIDLAAIHGAGVNSEPMGIYATANVQAKAMAGVPDYAKVVEMTGMAADKNALAGSTGWITTPLMAALLKTKPVISGAAAGFVWDGTVHDGTMAGYRGRSTSQVSKTMSTLLPTGGAQHGMIFGDWSQLVIGTWGGMELVPDEVTRKKEGIIEIASFQMLDVIIRHEESFVVATGATLT